MVVLVLLQAWRLVREQSGLASSLEVLTLEFYLHVYFATLPLRHGHKQVRHTPHPLLLGYVTRYLSYFHCYSNIFFNGDIHTLN